MKKDPEKTTPESARHPMRGQPATPASSNSGETPAEGRDFLSREDAAAGGPADSSVSGEEDPGAGLEALVKRDK